jgi:hypothetical protein
MDEDRPRGRIHGRAWLALERDVGMDITPLCPAIGERAKYLVKEGRSMMDLTSAKMIRGVKFPNGKTVIFAI